MFIVRFQGELHDEPMCHWNFGSPAILGPSGGRMGIAEDARTRGCPSPPLGGFGFVGLHRDYAYYADYATKVGVRMSAFFSKADIHKHRFRLSPNVCFRPQAAVAYLREKVKVASRLRLECQLLACVPMRDRINSAS